MASCAQLDDYLANRLSNDDVKAFEQHMTTCAACNGAVTRKRAVERAQKVLQRNAAVRTGQSPAISRNGAAKVATQEAFVPPSKAITVESVTIPQQRFDGPDADEDAPKGAGARKAVVAVAVVAVIAVVAIAMAKRGASSTKEPAAPVAAVRNEPAAPAEPEVPALEPMTAVPAKGDVPKPTEPAKPAESAADATAKSVETSAKSAEAAAKSAETALPEPGPSGFYAVGTDIEVLAQVVASKKCGQAVSALKARVVTNPNEARSWALLTTCYAKRRRWQDTLDAYAKVVQHGNSAMVASVQGSADKAKSALEAEASATATPAPVETP